MKMCTLLMEISKEGAQSLRMKMPTAELYLKEATVRGNRKQTAVTNIIHRQRMV